MTKIIVHNEPDMNTSGLYKRKEDEIHIIEKEVLYRYVLEHEKVHAERRNKLVTRIAWLTYSYYYWISVLVIYGVSFIGVNYFNVSPYISFIIFPLVFIPVYLNDREEGIVYEVARQRVMGGLA